jgi:DNA-binding MarR family transcriptional regulator
MPSTLARRIKQHKPFASLEHEAYLSVLQLAGDLERETAEALKAHGLSVPQYNVLRVLRGAGDGGMACGDIAERLIAKAPDMTRLLDRLERQGLITRAREATDRRVVTARITEKGREVLTGLDAPIALLHERQFGHLSADRLRDFLNLLGEVSARPHPP